MNTINKSELPSFGAPIEGGRYAGLILINGAEYGLAVSPRAYGEIEESAWGCRGMDVSGARSCADGHQNTLAMAEAGSDLARWMLTLDINGFTDWYLPSRDELELMYRNLKPTSAHNYCYFRDGDNPSSLPAGYPYTEESPARTDCAAFKDGGDEALASAWYWSSTQGSPDGAWGQGFGGGGQDDDREGDELRARAVRRFKVNP